MTRVLLLEPTASVLGLSTYAAHNILEPIGLEYMASYLEELGYQCHVLQQRCQSREKTLTKIMAHRPSVLGISTQAYNIDDALWFAREAKQALPKLIVVLGGYHASACPELAEESCVDYVVIGEGEVVFASLLDTLAGGRPLAGVPGVAYYDGELHINERPKRIDDLDSLPFPKRDKKILAQCRMHGLMYPPPSKQMHVGMVTASRGCPYSCAFCCSQLIWNQQIRNRSPRNVADELEAMAGEYGVNAVFFCDLTFNADKRYVIDLCGEISKRDVPIHFYAMCNLRGMDREIAEAMAAAKCAKIGFGVESFTDIVRLNMKDKGGMGLDETNRILDEVSASGILSKAYFIIGFPWETDDTLTELQRVVAELHADEIKTTFYVPFPGTRGYELHKSLLTTTHWADFTTLSQPIVRNDSVTPEELQRFRKAIFNSFYSSKLWQERVVERIEMSPKYRESFEEFVAFLREKGIVSTELSVTPFREASS